jgi:hypothetical protein
VGTGVLQSLTTVSKLVVRALREPAPASAESPATSPVEQSAAAEAPVAVGDASEGPEDAPSLVLVSSGTPAIEAGRLLLLPLVLADSAGHEHHIEVRVEITGTRDPAQ